ncbi:response regulator [Paenibacillus abyssi]|uniref:Response regulator n=2 Tax=Paenibacillus abyssi TaxID=1340531 RepID=A0A917FL01_9BACL|nr:response regulator [Paenibacillus abyssi]
MLLAEVFQIAGFKVQEAQNGRMAIAKFSEHPFDVVLLDLRMPYMSGIEALREIRRMDQEVIAVMFSAYGDQANMDEAKRLGVRRFFSKPFDIELLKNHVLEQLQ